MNKILEIDKLSKDYYSDDGLVVAIEDITLDIYDGEYLSIVGPSGCGKSTLLNIIGGIDNKSSGNIKMDGNVKIGYMLQEDCLFPWLTILDNCLLGLKLRNELTENSLEYVKGLLKTYGLADFLDKYPSSLSGGMRQRVGCI